MDLKEASASPDPDSVWSTSTFVIYDRACNIILLIMEEDSNANKTAPDPNPQYEEVELKAVGQAQPGKGDRAAELIGNLQVELTEEDVR